MRTILILFAVPRAGAHAVVFREFAEGLARVIARRHGEMRVRVVNG